jgi:hypothetical protein
MKRNANSKSKIAPKGYPRCRGRVNRSVLQVREHSRRRYPCGAQVKLYYMNELGLALKGEFIEENAQILFYCDFDQVEVPGARQET